MRRRPDELLLFLGSVSSRCPLIKADASSFQKVHPGATFEAVEGRIVPYQHLPYVDNEAIIEVLESGKICRVSLDVLVRPRLDTPVLR